MNAYDFDEFKKMIKEFKVKCGDCGCRKLKNLYVKIYGHETFFTIQKITNCPKCGKLEYHNMAA